MENYNWLVNDVETLMAYIGDGYTKAVLKRCVDAIEELQSVVEHYAEVCATEIPRWISVNERLPKDDEAEKYLVVTMLSWYGVSAVGVDVCYYTSSLEDVDTYEFAGVKHGGFYFYDREYGYCEKTDVQYWMPLPQPPKEEKI